MWAPDLFKIEKFYQIYCELKYVIFLEAISYNLIKFQVLQI